MRRVVITGIGIISCIGNNKDEVLDSLLNTKSGIVFSDDHKKYKFRSQVDGEVKNLNLSEHFKTNTLIYIFEKTAYISDCNDMSIINYKDLKNLKYLIIDCLKLERHSSHFNLKESLFIHKCLNPKKTILTNLHNDLDYNILLKRLPSNVVQAYDGLKINL